MTVLMIALGAGLGAPARFLTDRAVQARHRSAFPWGTLSVNVAASLLLGIFAGAAGHLDSTVSTLVGTGFCGTLSTYSTFSYETLRLMQDGARRLAAANVILSVLAGIGAAALGWSIGSAVT